VVHKTFTETVPQCKKIQQTRKGLQILQSMVYFWFRFRFSLLNL